MSNEGQKSWRGKGTFRRWPEKEKVPIPEIPRTKQLKITTKQIAYWHAYLGQDPVDIANRFPRALTLSKVFHALGDYFDPDKREAFDAEIKNDLAFSQRKALDCSSMSLPSMRPVVAK